MKKRMGLEISKFKKNCKKNRNLKIVRKVEQRESKMKKEYKKSRKKLNATQRIGFFFAYRK